MTFSIKLWGVRGSLPAPYSPNEVEAHVEKILRGFFSSDYHFEEDIPRYLKTLTKGQLGGFGGNTPCAEVRTSKTQIIIDGGSGIRSCGYELMKGACGKGKGEVHLFMTHFHWDHLIGLPFFVPIFVPGNQIHVYSVQEETEEIFQTIFKKPFFPVPYDQLEAQFHYHVLPPRKKHVIGDLSLTPYELDHPDPCWGYRIENGGKSIAYCVDTECTRSSREKLGSDLPLYQNADVMIFDAQYTLREVSLEKINWGHSAAVIGLDLAMREGIKKVYFVHHDPMASDDRILAMENETRDYYQSQMKTLNKKGAQVEWHFAREEIEIDV